MKRNQLNIVIVGNAHTGACFSKSFNVEAPKATNGDRMLIKDVRIVEEGEAKGHDVWLDADFVKKTVELAKGRRIKCRMGHPDMCKESFGTAIGRYENFRVMEDENGSYAVADLHLFKAANKSPHGQLADHVKEMSEEAPDMFGNSIEFKMGNMYRKTDKGIKVYAGYVDGEYKYFTADGVLYDEKIHGIVDEEKRYATNEALYNSDLVDEPAATSSLFSIPFIQRFAALFGGGYPGLKKAALQRKILTEIKNMLFSDINATTSDGATIVVKAVNDYIYPGDTVVDDAGAPLADGKYDITDSDSGQTGITIAVAAGVITGVSQTAMSDEKPEEVVAAQDGLSAVQKTITSLSAKVEAIENQMSKLLAKGVIDTAQFTAITERLGIVEKQPAGEKSVVAATDKKTKDEPVSAYQEQANKDYESRFPKK